MTVFLIIILLLQVADWCLDAGIGLVAVGPEAPLVDGLTDYLQANGLRHDRLPFCLGVSNPLQ